MRRSKKILICKIACVLFAAVVMFLPQRGQPYSDIRVLATVLGIDGSSGDVKVSAQLAVPVAQGSDGQASTVIEGSGGSLAEALENLEIGLGRRIDYGHLSTVAIGKDMRLSDIKPYVGCLLSSGKAGPGAYLVYCPESEAAEFIRSSEQMGESSDAELGNFISYSKSGNHVSTITVLQFLQGLNSSSHAAFVPCVATEDDEQGESKGSGGSQGGEQQQGDEQQQGGSEKGGEQKKKLVAADSVAVFGGQGDGATVLDSLTTRGIVWQDPNSDFGLTELRNAVIDGQEVPSVPARLVGKRVRRSVKHTDGENTFTYKIKIKLRLEDAQLLGNPLDYEIQRKALEKYFESMIENNIMSTVKMSKETGIDFLSFRETFRKYCKKGYESFDLSAVNVRVEAKVCIRT